MPVFNRDVAGNADVPRPLARDIFGRRVTKLPLWRRVKEWAIARAAAA